MTTKKRQFSPKPTHFVSFNKAVAPPTIKLYGKLIDGGETKPADLHLSHPSDPGSLLHRSLVYGYADAGRCETLAYPQQVWLPAPDGPADGCGWSPQEFLVWKSVRPDWMTLHVTTERKPLSVALAAGRSLDLAELPPTWDARIISVVKEWAKVSSNPDRGSVLGVLYVDSGGSVWQDGAQYLAQLLKQRLNVVVSPGAISQSMTIDDLIKLIV